jgi:hypothetical protein
MPKVGVPVRRAASLVLHIVSICKKNFRQILRFDFHIDQIGSTLHP